MARSRVRLETDWKHTVATPKGVEGEEEEEEEEDNDDDEDEED